MNFTNSVVGKRWMAFAGIVWFAYVVFHMVSLLNFHAGKEIFNDFYTWFNQLPFYYLMVAVLIFSLGLHVFTAISRQLANNKSKGVGNKKPYPKEIPRVVAWSGASTLLMFVVFHFVQMQLLDQTDLHQQLLNIFTQPIMLIVYVLGTITLSTHLHHALSNVLQTLGVSSKQNNPWVVLIVLILFFGFVSVPVSIIYA
ncbi:hypothetical protein [Candidatus Thioglobus sp.]|jgi:hypothetical protein|uniref:hypothetical protein n=1 Tax=Candidatus Thioglobus sp. TaxID=2026721 RepID=UPI00176C625B|nr:hypothetical protein [Candidatus Thioglobus sp.]